MNFLWFGLHLEQVLVAPNYVADRHLLKIGSLSNRGPEQVFVAKSRNTELHSKQVLLSRHLTQ